MQPAFSIHYMYTPVTLQVHSSSGWAMKEAGGLTSTSSCIFITYGDIMSSRWWYHKWQQHLPKHNSATFALSRDSSKNVYSPLVSNQSTSMKKCIPESTIPLVVDTTVHFNVAPAKFTHFIVACHLPRGSKLRWCEDMGGKLPSVRGSRVGWSPQPVGLQRYRLYFYQKNTAIEH